MAFRRLFPDGRYNGDLSIEPSEGSLGRHYAEEELFRLDTPDKEFHDHLRREAVYACAGYAALLAAGSPEEEAANGCGPDFEIGGHHHEGLDVAKEEAVNLMRQPENVRAVEVVAGELLRLGTVDAQVLDVLLSWACGEASEKDYLQVLPLMGVPLPPGVVVGG